MARSSSATLWPRWAESAVLAGLQSMADSLARARVSPNLITTIGFVVTCLAGLAFDKDYVRLAGGLVLAGGILDVFDGHVARTNGSASVFGSFYDSTLDRISEIVVFLGVLSLYNDTSVPRGDVLMIYAVTLAMAGSLMISYTRARAEAIGLDCKVGVMQRPERIVLVGMTSLIFGLAWDGLALKVVFVTMAILTNLTVVQRIVWVYQRTRAATPTSTTPNA
ncbi:MAG: CDP-alcohol phosphatidyltransferase family protein [Gemmatimonadota bacterium]|nr:CDP-alcohol phosphatidyltransferase family protein [Gemmatimonadota bacterium]